MWSGGWRWAGVAAWRSALAGGLQGESRETPAESGGLAGRAGTESHCPRAGEREPHAAPGAGWPGRRSPPCAAPRRRPSIPPAARTFLGVSGLGIRGPGKRQRRWPELARSGCFCRRLRAGSRLRYLLAPNPRLAPSGLSPEPGKAGAGASPSQLHRLGGMLLSTKTRVYSRPSRSGKGHQSSELGPVLRAAELPCRPQPLLSQTPTPGAGSSCFISLSWDPRLLGPLGGLPPSSSTPVLPVFLFPIVFRTSFFPKFLLIRSRCTPTPPPPPRSCCSSGGLPTLSFPPFLPLTRPLPSQLYPNLFLFSPASPHHEFPLSVPRFPVSSPPTAPRFPGEG